MTRWGAMVADGASRVGRQVLVGGSVALLLTSIGCRHRSAPVTLPAAATAPVPLATVPGGKISAVVPPVAPVPTPLPSVAVTPPKPKRIRRKPVTPSPAAAAATSLPGAPAANAPLSPPAAPAAPVQVAGATPPPPVPETLGALSTGAQSDPALQARATELIAEVKKRIEALPASVVSAHAEGVARVRLFYREADAALKSGDADGAWTLATKARVLLDELTG